MWTIAWLLVGSAPMNQPTYPPFATEQDCALVKQVYMRGRNPDAISCVQARILVTVKP